MLQSNRKRSPIPGWLLAPLLGVFSMLSPLSHAETVSVALSQEQDGGEAGRACIYVHQGKAEFRVVKPGESCAAHIIIESHRS